MKKHTPKPHANSMIRDGIEMMLVIVIIIPYHRAFSIHIIGTATDVCVVSNALILRLLYPFAMIVVHIDVCAPLFVMGQVAATYIMKTNAIDVEGE